MMIRCGSSREPVSVPVEEVLQTFLVEHLVAKEEFWNVVGVSEPKRYALVEVVESDRFVHRRATRRE